MDRTENAIDKIPIKTIQKGVTKVMRKGNYQETAQKGLADMIPNMTRKQMKQTTRLLKRAGQSKEEIEDFVEKWNLAHPPIHD